jgi:hypothetical protein
MISAFWSVVQDLFWFVFGRSHVETPSVTYATLPPRLPVASLAEPLAPVLLPKTASLETIAPPVETPVTQPDVPLSGLEPNPAAPLHEPTVMYVSNLAGTPCLRTPTFEFDSVLLIIPYGAAVTVAAYTGRYARVLHGATTGWVFKDDVTPHKQAVWPELKEWVIYQADAPEVKKIRALIGDSFSSGDLDLPLQAGEYIALRLKTENRNIAWPENRPRLPGNWQTILKGVAGIHNTIMPRTGSVMEWQTESDGGRLAFVESVGPDNTITVSCVGLVMAGQFTKQAWVQEEWRELRPVFIEVT